MIKLQVEEEMRSVCLFKLLLSLAVLASTMGHNDVAMLLRFKKALGEHSATRSLASWNPQTSPSQNCSPNWLGIACDSGRVTGIALDGLNLSAADIFPLLSSLTLLRTLSLSGNRFTGAVSHIESFKLLHYLDLSSNMFHGAIPAGLSDLALLKHVDFSRNKFSGNVMDFLLQLGDVVHVDLSGNLLSGSLDLGIGNSTFISSIEYLNVSGNSLEGTLFAHDGVPYFDSLTVLDASDNLIAGVLPPFQFMLSLRFLSLAGNMLSGSIPQLILLESSMVLSELHLSCNNLNGSLEKITSTTLKTVNVSFNFLSGPLPSSVGSCAVLDLSNNMFTGSVAGMRNWSNEIEEIQLASNMLYGMLPEETSPFYWLASLNISNNSLNGTLSEALLSFPKLGVLDLSGNNISGSIPSGFFVPSRLAALDLSQNHLSGEISLHGGPHNISLERLDLSHNNLFGRLPEELKRLKNLVYLNLSYNQLEGVIPRHLPGKMTALDLSSNNLSGLLPDSLERFPSSSFHPGNQFLIVPNGVSSIRRSARNDTKIVQLVVLLAIFGVTALVGISGFCCIFQRKKLDARKGSPLPNTTKEVEFQKTTRQREHSSVCFSSSSEDSLPCNGALSPLNPPLMIISSPGKLSDDLCLFDKSLYFTAEELSSAPAEMVGRSCHGTTYRVNLGDDRVLSVKWMAEGISKGKKDFVRELKKLADITHPNLLSYRGCYLGSNDHEKMIVSTYVESRNLGFYLKESSRMKLKPLSLDERLRISIAVAECLNHLHNERSIPHGNLKASNILIAPSMNPFLSDYSLHRLLTAAGTAEQVLDAGALGYMPPEFGSSMKPCPSLNSDVFAFGVVLLELLTGRNTDHDLTDWVRDLAKENRIDECFDMAIIDVNRIDTIRGMLQVAMKCLMSASERPDINTVSIDLTSLASK